MIAVPSSQWYKEVDTKTLIQLVEEAKERAEFTPDAGERQLWRKRLEGMKEELYRRQELLEEIEV